MTAGTIRNNAPNSGLRMPKMYQLVELQFCARAGYELFTFIRVENIVLHTLIT